MNKTMITGRLGKDADLKTGASGAEFCDFSCGVDLYNLKEKKNDTIWYNCRAFGKTAVMISTYFKKGDGIELEGHMETSKKDDKTYWNLIVERAYFPKGKRAETSAVNESSGSSSESPVPGFTPMDEGECPF